jgi:hypothetical protein
VWPQVSVRVRLKGIAWYSTRSRNSWKASRLAMPCGFNAPMLPGRIKDPPAFASYNIGGLVLVSRRSVWEQDRSQTILHEAHQTIVKRKVDRAEISWVEKVLTMEYLRTVMVEICRSY